MTLVLVVNESRMAEGCQLRHAPNFQTSRPTRKGWDAECLALKAAILTIAMISSEEVWQTMLLK